MVYKPIIVVAGEPNSILSEILFKSLKNRKFKSPIILIASKKLIELQKTLQKDNFWKDKNLAKKTVKQKKNFEDIINSYKDIVKEVDNLKDLLSFRQKCKFSS